MEKYFKAKENEMTRILTKSNIKNSSLPKEDNKESLNKKSAMKQKDKMEIISENKSVNINNYSNKKKSHKTEDNFYDPDKKLESEFEKEEKSRLIKKKKIKISPNKNEEENGIIIKENHSKNKTSIKDKKENKNFS